MSCSGNNVDCEVLEELERLRTENAKLKAEKAELEQGNLNKQRQIEILQRDLQALLDRLARRPKDVSDPNQQTFEDLVDEFFKECETAADEEQHDDDDDDDDDGKEKKRYNKKHPGRAPLPESLPRNRILVDIPDDEKVDPITGEPLEIVGEKVTEKVEYIPAHYRVNQYVRPVYHRQGSRDFAVAELPAFALDKVQVDHGYLANIATRRFVDHLPYYREVAADQRHGLDFGRNQYDRWMLQIADLLFTLYTLLCDDVYARSYIGFDATGVKLQVKGKGKLHSAQMWVARAGPNTGPEHVCYKFTLTKESHEVVELLRDFQGYVQTDAAPTHDTAMKSPSIIEVGCWAHTTRKFKAARAHHPEEGKKILDWIRELYDIEEDGEELTVDERLTARQRQSIPILEDMFTHFEKIYMTARALPQSDLGKAIAYALNQKKQLHRYLEDGRIRIDNNWTEHALRAFGIGRKNWNFVGSERGGRAAAVFMSLFMSCRVHGINPWLYMKDILDRIRTEPDLHALLPGYWQPLKANTELGVPVYIKTEQPKTIDV